MNTFPELKNDSFLRAINFQPVDSTPVWMMRQAGRYLPEYKKVRATAGDFLSLCKNTEFACEVTLQPLRRFPLDAAILFSDILTIPDAMGLGLYFETGEGPKFKHTVRSMDDVKALPNLDASVDLDYVKNAVTTIRHALNGDVPLIGFSGSPWTLATYMIEGGSSKDFRFGKQMMFAEPDTLHLLLQKLTDAVIDYLKMQIVAGAQVVQIFDSWGGALAHRQFKEFSLDYLTKIVSSLKQAFPHIPVICFTKGGGIWLNEIKNLPADMLGFDWTMPLNNARKELADTKIAIQGNLDPATLYAAPQVIKQHTELMLDDVYQQQKANGQPLTGYVANLGHGITQWVNPDHAKVFIETVKNYRLSS